MSVHFANFSEFNRRCLLCYEPIDGLCTGHKPEKVNEAVAHFFHRSCLWEWFHYKSHQSCPRCQHCEVINAKNFADCIVSESLSPLERGRYVVIATRYNQLNDVQKQLNSGIISDKHRNEALLIATYNNNLPILQKILESGISEEDSRAKALLYAAAFLFRKDMITAILKCGSLSDIHIQEVVLAVKKSQASEMDQNEIIHLLRKT